MKQLAKSTLQALSACCLLACAAAHATPSYQVSQIIDVPAFSYAVSGMNNADRLLVTQWGEWPTLQAGIYQNGQTTLLGTLPGSNASSGRVLNDRGDVLGYAYNSVDLGSSGRLDNPQPFIYRNGTLSPLAPTLGANATPLDMNNAGDIAGHLAKTDSTVQEAFVYRNGQMTMLGTPRWSSSTAQAINNNGTVAGTYDRFTDDITRVFVNENGQSRILGDFGNARNTVLDINDMGQLLITGDKQTVLYDGGKTTVLAQLTQGLELTNTFKAVGLGTDGAVLGWSFSDQYEFQPLLFAEGKQWNINDLLNSSLPPGAHIQDVLDIDEHNRILAQIGQGQFALLTPLAAVPEPGRLLFMTMGMLAIVGTVKRRQS